MRNSIIFAAIALFAVSSGAALAEHADLSLNRTSQSRVMPVDEFKKKINNLGYSAALRSTTVSSRRESSTARAGFS